tara:strand:+ start:879 stop:1475 length:597 start_codon:yes stop_codon:yes gene_type:complete
MSIKIQVPEFKGFKVVKTPEAQNAIDQVINKNWWNDQGWSTMYDLTYQELIDRLKSGNFLDKSNRLSNNTLEGLEGMKFHEEADLDTDTQERLAQVFDFLEKKENKLNPLTDRSDSDQLKVFKEPNTVVVGKKGFSVGGRSFPLPVDGSYIENEQEFVSPIVDILDDGIFVMKTQEEIFNSYPPSWKSEVAKDQMYII